LEISDIPANDITYQIQEAAFRVHAELGRGPFESVYEAAIAFELPNAGLQVQSLVGKVMHDKPFN